MTSVKFVILGLLVLAMSFLCLLLANLVGEKFLGLGDPIVYDSHSLWGYSPRASKQYIRFNSQIVTINNVGARGNQNWAPSGNNIVFLGDSVTYGGSYINDDQTFSSLVCSDITGWVCHNAGVNAYGILNMVARSRYDFRLAQAPIRIFTFIIADFDRGLQDPNTAHFILREPPSNFSAVWEILNFVAALIEPKSWFGKNSDIADETKISQTKLVSQLFSLDVLLDELNRLDKLGKQFLLIHSPTIDEFKTSSTLQNNPILSTLAKKYPNRFISLLDTLEKITNDKKLLYKDELHFTKEGHKFVANHIKPAVKELINDIERIQ